MCNAPFFTFSLFLFHGLNMVPLFQGSISFFDFDFFKLDFQGLTIRFRPLRIQVYLFLISYFISYIIMLFLFGHYGVLPILNTTRSTYSIRRSSPKLSVPLLAQWRTRHRIRTHFTCKDHGSQLRFIRHRSLDRGGSPCRE